MFSFNLITFLLILFSLNQILCIENIPQDKITNKVNHHLQWITNQTCFPIKLSIPVDLKHKNDSLNWDWMRTSDQKLVSFLPDILKNYLVAESDSRASLYIANYDNQTHEQLSSYEPKLVFNDKLKNPTYLNEQRDIFTLAYLKKHYVKAEKKNNTFHVSCIADFLISNSNNEHTDEILKLMEKYASFKLAIRSANFPMRPKNKPIKQQEFLFLFDNENQHEQHQQQQHQQQQDYQQQKSRVNHNEQYVVNQPVHVQQHQPIFYPEPQPIYHQQYPIYPQPSQQEFYYQNPYHYEQIDRENEFRNDMHFAEMIEEYNNFVMNYHPKIGYPHFELQPKYRQREFIHPLDRHDYNDYFYRLKRSSRNKKFVKNEKLEADEEDFDYDSSKFSKVRLSLGPVMIHKPFENEEVVSCMLNLMNYDEVNLAYHSRIFKTIKTGDFKENDDLNNKNSESISQKSSDKQENGTEHLIFNQKNKSHNLDEVIETTTKPAKNMKNEKVKPATMMMFLTDNNEHDKFDHFFNGQNSMIKNFSIFNLSISFIFYITLNYFAF
ncbi:unnamed protein product [Brachionus calyciflorus]|uniref:Uncharacterized protein n=1 Tax=Brachionus calyciflorus TaxID=104777 RepID=A0A813W6U2_9BILA|nr:unnamed protein product [Brachionus calyciflorus]